MFPIKYNNHNVMYSTEVVSKMKTVLMRLMTAGCLIILIILSGCAQPPTEQIEKAEKTLEHARSLEADLYAADLYKQAAEAVAKAKDLVAKKKYDEAKRLAEESSQRAQEAVLAVGANKAKMKTDTERMLQEVSAAIDELKKYVAAALRKKAPLNREEIQAKIGRWEIDAINIEEELRNQKIKSAHDSLTAMRDQVRELKESLLPADETTAEKKQ